MFNSIMHVTFWTHQLDEMMRFYTEVMGGELKVVTRAKAYLESMGFEFDESTAKYKGEKLNAIYLKEEIGGFAIHLVNK